MLYEDEEVITSIRQSRMAQIVTPDSIFVTNHRIILYSPHALGLRKSIEWPISRWKEESSSVQ
jgi:hypothetical protein